MNENDVANVSSISRAETLDEIADFWDQTREVDFEVRAKRRRRVTLDPDVYEELETQARQRGLAPETLVNL